MTFKKNHESAYSKLQGFLSVSKEFGKKKSPFWISNCFLTSCTSTKGNGKLDFKIFVMENISAIKKGRFRYPFQTFCSASLGDSILR